MKTTLRTWTRAALLLLATGLLVPFRADAQVVINTGTPGPPVYAVGPIYLSSTMFYKFSRYAYLYTQDELTAVGITPNTVIDQVGWMKSTAATAAGPANFKVYMKNSATTAYAAPSAQWSTLSSGATLVYENAAQSIPANANPEFVNFTLSEPFTYTGGSLEILTEWDVSMAPSPIATGSFEWENTTVVDRIYGFGGSSMSGTLSSTNNNVSIDDKRPVIQFTLDATSGIGQAAPSAAFTLYPNPANQVLNVVFSAPLDNVEVLDVLGQVVHAAGRFTGGPARIDVSQLTPGAYFLRAQTLTGPVVKRFAVR